MTVEFYDAFDGSTTLTERVGTGTITETGGQLVMATAVGAASNWELGAQNAPLAYTAFTPGYCVRLTARCSYNAGETNRGTPGLFIMEDLSNWLAVVCLGSAGDVDSNRVVGGGAVTQTDSLAGYGDPHVTPQVYRLDYYVTRTPPSTEGCVLFYVSDDDGVTWDRIHGEYTTMNMAYAGVFVRTWATAGGNLESKFDWLQFEVLDNTKSRISNSQVWSFTGLSALPKQWTFKNCDAYPHAANTTSFDADGTQISIPASGANEGVPQTQSWWTGMAAAGWSLSNEAGYDDFDIECSFNNFTHNNHNGHKIGVGVRRWRFRVDWHFDNKDWPSSASDLMVMVNLLYDVGTGSTIFELVTYDNVGPFGRWISHGATGAVGVTEGKVRLTRVGGTFEGWYDVGAGWVSIATCTYAAISDPLDRVDPILALYFGTPIGAALSGKFSECRVNDGYIIPGPDHDFDEDFTSSIVPGPTRWSGPPVTVYGNYNVLGVDEGDGGFYWDYTNASHENTFSDNFVLYPGTDIDIQWDVSMQALATDNYVGFVLRAMHTNQNFNIGCALHYAGDLRIRAWCELNATPFTWWGDTDIPDAFPTRHTLRLTRVSSLWSAYYGPAGGVATTPLGAIGGYPGEYDDSTNKLFTDHPLQLTLFSYRWSGIVERRWYNVTLNAGDYDNELWEEASASFVRVIEDNYHDPIFAREGVIGGALPGGGNVRTGLMPDDIQ